MTARSPHEPHRASTPLELLFDLCSSSRSLRPPRTAPRHRLWARARRSHRVLMVFFAIWWAWMNLTWFASAYDSDDVPYRLEVFVQITGALIFAAGVPRAFESRQAQRRDRGGYA